MRECMRGRGPPSPNIECEVPEVHDNQELGMRCAPLLHDLELGNPNLGVAVALAARAVERLGCPAAVPEKGRRKGGKAVSVRITGSWRREWCIGDDDI